MARQILTSAVERKTIEKKNKECSQVGISILNMEKVTPGQRATGSRVTSRGTSWGTAVPVEGPASTRSLREVCPAWAGQHGGRRRWAAGTREEDKDSRKGRVHQAFPGRFQAPSLT